MKKNNNSINPIIIGLSIGFLNPIYAGELSFDYNTQSCIATESTKEISIPCVKVKENNEVTNHSISLIKDENDDFIISDLHKNDDSKENTVCDAFYNLEKQTLDIPCVRDSDNEELIYTLSMRYNAKNKTFNIIETQESFLPKRKNLRKIMRKASYLPDSATLYNLMSRGGGSGWQCRNDKIQLSGNVNASIYTITGEYHYNYGVSRPRSKSYNIYLYRDEWGRDPLVAVKRATSYNYGNTTNFSPLASNLPSGKYYWCMYGMLSKAKVNLYK